MRIAITLLTMALMSAPAKAQKIINTGRHADTGPDSRRMRDQAAHGQGITRMKAARNTCRSENLHQIGTIANIAGTKTFTEITVQFDLVRHPPEFAAVTGTARSKKAQQQHE